MERSSEEILTPEAPRKWRRGDVGPDGRVFWEKHKAFPSGEYWVDAQDYPRMLEAKRASKRAFYLRHREKILEKDKQRRKAVGMTAEQKAARKAYRDANAKRLRQREKEWRKKATAERPELRVFSTMRTRLKIAVKAAVGEGATISSRAQDRESVSFLMWLAARMGVDVSDGSVWHIDHLVPISKCPDLSKANAPENVRWLPATANTARKDADPTPEEATEHLKLVEEWRKLRDSKKSA